jgi:ribosomal protein S18 acetylase RimI-like enzyme
MKIEFRKADVAKELRSLIRFDHEVFQKADWFTADDWQRCIPHWMIVGNRKVGCCAFDPRPGRALYVWTTGILPSQQGRGLGALLKSWQIAYAQHHGFTRIITNSRQSNRAMIALNKKFGFKILRTSKSDYYRDPAEPAVVMEWRRGGPAS